MAKKLTDYLYYFKLIKVYYSVTTTSSTKNTKDRWVKYNYRNNLLRKLLEQERMGHLVQKQLT